MKTRLFALLTGSAVALSALGSTAQEATAPAPVPTGAPAPGVYECMNQQAVVTPMAFGLIDGSSYMSSGGRRGRYSYDAKSGVLILDPGATPARYKRAGPTWFRPIKEDGALGGFTCPLNRAKNPLRPPW